MPATRKPEPLAAAGEQGLRLRFESDRDFLRLVEKGEVRVFAFRTPNVFGLARNLEFLAAEPPGKVYELMRETIPGRIARALDRATPESAGYSWGIRMPVHMERKIREFVTRNAVGELVINRYGEVHHVVAPS